MGLLAKNEHWSENFKNLEAANKVFAAIEFDSCTFEDCNFSGATFQRCTFVECEFIRCNLSMAKLEYSKFSEVFFRDSKLVGINWNKVTWPGFILDAPIQFYNCILNDSSFYGLTLQHLVIEACKAHDVDFREGDFSHSNFTYTELVGSLFINTNLSGADFSEATDYDIDISQNSLKKAKFSRFEATRLLEYLEIELVD